MKIVFFEFDNAFQNVFDPLVSAHTLTFTSESLTLENVATYQDAEVVSIFNETELSEAILCRLPNLKHLALRKTGFDDVPQPYCKENGITFSTVPVYGQQTVAEHAFALLLNLSHRLTHETARIRSGDFQPKAPPGFDLAGRTLGIIGTGNIGQFVIKIATGFGMKILAHDIAPNHSLAAEYGFTYLDKMAMISQCDVLTLHVPLDESTFHIVGRQELEAMPTGSVLINTARGNVIDIVAVRDALVSGKLRGACLDVFPQEPRLRGVIPPEVPMDVVTAQELLCVREVLAMPNVVATPHMGYNTTEAIHRILNTTLKNIQAL